MVEAPPPPQNLNEAQQTYNYEEILELQKAAVTKEAAEQEFHATKQSEGETEKGKKSLLSKVFNKLRDKITLSNKVVAGYNNPKVSQENKNQQEAWAAECANPVYQILKGVLGNDITTYTDSETPLKPVALTLLTSIATAENTDYTASTLLPIIEKIMSTPDYIKFSRDGKKTQFELDLDKHVQNRKTAEILKRALIDALSRDQLPGIQQIGDIDTKLLALNRDYRKEDQNEQQKFEKVKDSVRKLLSDEKDPQKREIPEMALEFVDGMVSTKDFYLFSKRQFERNASMMFPDKQLDQLSKEERSKVSVVVAEKMQKVSIAIINSIYSTVLGQQSEPEELFDAAARRGDYYTNPQILYDAFVMKLTSLHTSAEQFNPPDSDLKVTNTKDADGNETGDFFILKRDEQTEWNEKVKGFVTKVNISHDFAPGSYRDFLKELEVVAITEKGLLEYGHNFRLFTIKGKYDNQNLFAAISSFSRDKLTASSLDRLYGMTDSSMVSSVQGLLIMQLMRRFSENNWEKRENIIKEVFSSSDTIFTSLSEHLEKTYKNVPAWQRTRAARHAMTVTLGADFMLQMLNSYAMPPRTYGGTSDKSGGNSTFDSNELAKRWGWGGHDSPANFNGADYLPADGKPENYDHKIHVPMGFAVWNDMHVNGRLACWRNETYKNTIPWVAQPSNVTETGGIHSWFGWRVRDALRPLFDSRLTELNIHNEWKFNIHEPKIFEQAWKSIENDGVNNIHGLMDEFLNGDFLKLGTGKEGEGPKDAMIYEERYQEFTKFLADKYFCNDDSIVKDSLPNGVSNGDEYWANHIKPQIDKIIADNKKDGKDDSWHAKAEGDIKNLFYDEIHKAMGVMIFERTPTEFLDRFQRYNEQNGVTMQDQLIEEFQVGRPGGWTPEQWQTTIKDIQGVTLEMRKRTTDEINKNRREWGNIYGNIDDLHSNVNNGKGYKITVEDVESILVKQYAAVNKPNEQNISYADLDPPFQKRIDNAKEFYLQLRQGVIDKPAESDLEKGIKRNEKGDPIPLTEKEGLSSSQKAQFREKMVNRFDWFVHSWKTNEFNGVEFLIDNGPFKLYSATDENLVARTAGQIEATAQLVKDIRSDLSGENSIYKKSKSQVRNGADVWEEILKIYSPAKSQLNDEIDSSATQRFIKQDFIRFFHMVGKDDSAKNVIGKINYTLMKKGKDSIAAEKFTNWIGQSMDSGDFRAFLRLMSSQNLIPPDSVNEVAHKFDASILKMIFEIGQEWAIILVLSILLEAIKEGGEEMQDED